MSKITLLEANQPDKVGEAINELSDALENVSVSKESLGIDRVDNTPDAEKPVSAPQKYYIDSQDEVTKNRANEYANSAVAGERDRALAAESALQARISAQEGVGGALSAYDFGVAIPTQEALTAYALSQIPSISDAVDIWNGTHVTNLFDNNVWQLNNTPATNPPIFEWAAIGSASVAQATNDTLGIVKGGEKIRVLPDGSLDADAESLGAATATQFAMDSTAKNITHLMVHNLEKTFSANGITAVSISFDNTVEQGFISGINFVSGATPPTVSFTNGSGYPFRSIPEENRLTFTPSANTTVNIVAYCDGINLYCYIAEA